MQRDTGDGDDLSCGDMEKSEENQIWAVAGLKEGNLHTFNMTDLN